MLSPKDFILRSANVGFTLLRFPSRCVDGLALSDEDKAFLLQAGLPKDASPFLSFEVPSSGELPTVAKRWGQPREFDRYRTIGSDGSGNPIALDESERGEVVCLDHEDRFSRNFMNQSIPQLAESLLAYRKLVRDTQAEFGEDAFLDGKSSEKARADLRRELTFIDAAAMKPGRFWPGALQNLDANAG